MTGDHLSMILKTANAKADKDGWETMPEGASLTLYLAHEGASLTVNRINALKPDGEIVYARTIKKDMLWAVARADLFAVGIDGAETTGPARRAGFG